MLRPEVPALGPAEAKLWHRAGWRRARVALLFLTSIVVLVVAVVTGQGDWAVSAAVAAAPVLLLTRPVLGVLAGLGVGVFLAASPESVFERIVFGLHALLCLAVLIGFWWQARAQRKIIAAVAMPVSIDLPDDLAVTTRTRARPFVVAVVTGIGVVAGFFAAEWWWLTGIFVVVALAREVAVRVLPARLMKGNAVAMLARAEPSRRVVLFTEALNPVASFAVIDVLHHPDHDDPLRTLGQEEPVQTPFVPATVIGDFRVGGWVAVVTDNCVLLPNGPVSDSYAPPVKVPPSLVDGRRWSGIDA